MNTNSSTPNSSPERESAGERQPDALSGLLRHWRVDSDLPPGFQAAVWQRIDHQARERAISSQPESPLAFLRGWMAGRVARPTLAAAYLAIIVSVGATAGWSIGQREAGRVRTELAQRYVQTLDPYAPHP